MYYIFKLGFYFVSVNNHRNQLLFIMTLKMLIIKIKRINLLCNLLHKTYKLMNVLNIIV